MNKQLTRSNENYAVKIVLDLFKIIYIVVLVIFIKKNVEKLLSVSNYIQI